MKSAASIKGHPIHPMLVVFPIAFWVGSFVADLIYLWREDPFWYRVSWIAMVSGLAGALAAAVPGIVDYFGSVSPHGEGKRIARLHGLLNLSLAALYGFNVWWRAGEGAVAGSDWWVAFASSAVGVAALAVSGWLGGELVYACEIGIERYQVGGQETLYGSRHSGKSGEFVEVAREGELGLGQVKHVAVNGAWIALVRTAQGYFAIDEVCTHEGGPLSDGVLVGNLVQCPWHGSRFDVRTGEVLAGPARVPIRTFETRVEGGSIRVRAPQGPESAAMANAGRSERTA